MARLWRQAWKATLKRLDSAPKHPVHRELELLACQVACDVFPQLRIVQVELTLMGNGTYQTQARAICMGSRVIWTPDMPLHRFATKMKRHFIRQINGYHMMIGDPLLDMRMHSRAVVANTPFPIETLSSLPPWALVFHQELTRRKIDCIARSLAESASTPSGRTMPLPRL